MEEAALLCIENKYKSAKRKVRIKNSFGNRPKTFEIDCLVNNDAHEIKWRDATTDGDHITKEHTRVKTIQSYNYKPIRVMFYYPQREQAKRIQEALKTLYIGVDGKYYYSDSAWEYIKNYTDVDLKNILETIAKSKTRN